MLWVFGFFLSDNIQFKVVCPDFFDGYVHGSRFCICKVLLDNVDNVNVASGGRYFMLNVHLYMKPRISPYICDLDQSEGTLH